MIGKETKIIFKNGNHIILDANDAKWFVEKFHRVIKTIETNK